MIPPTPGLEVCSFGHGERRRKAREEVAVFSPSFMPSERMRLWVALMRCPASLRLSIASSRTVSSSAMPEVYDQASFITRLFRLVS
jgi:hypothetical protein